MYESFAHISIQVATLAIMGAGFSFMVGARKFGGYLLLFGVGLIALPSVLPLLPEWVLVLSAVMITFRLFGVERTLHVLGKCFAFITRGVVVNVRRIVRMVW